ncbi:hypothetical protein ARMSODRAFT_977824 [Armillaria solidipes]|uniref:Uncharacterized protein n=1 Tax=Armillaria solidipes TaxID=1076256 RepID=A0A2H3BJH9_9AGAR|nr:hypothetical protein ARMSODRAFT_977824 [Armillaria solidipes]
MHPRTDFRFLSPIWQVLVGQQTNTAGEEHTPFIKNPRPTAGYEYHCQRSRWSMGEPPSLVPQSQRPHRAIVLSDLVTVVDVQRLLGDAPLRLPTNSSLPALVLELVEVFAEIRKFTLFSNKSGFRSPFADYTDLHRKDSFVIVLLGRPAFSLLLFINGLGKVSANGLHLPEVEACIVDSKRDWNPQEEGESVRLPGRINEPN